MPDMALKLHQTRLKKPLSPVERYLSEARPETEVAALVYARNDRQLLNHYADLLANQCEMLRARHGALSQQLAAREQYIRANIARIAELKSVYEQVESEMQERAHRSISRAQLATKQLDSLLSFMDQSKLRRALIRINQALQIERMESESESEAPRESDYSARSSATSEGAGAAQ